MGIGIMIAIAILLGLATIWLLWSSFQTNKRIKVAFESVERDTVFPSVLGFRDVLVEQEGDLELGKTFFSGRIV